MLLEKAVNDVLGKNTTVCIQDKVNQNINEDQAKELTSLTRYILDQIIVKHNSWDFAVKINMEYGITKINFEFFSEDNTYVPWEWEMEKIFMRDKVLKQAQQKLTATISAYKSETLHIITLSIFPQDITEENLKDMLGEHSILDIRILHKIKDSSEHLQEKGKFDFDIFSQFLECLSQEKKDQFGNIWHQSCIRNRYINKDNTQHYVNILDKYSSGAI